MKSLVAQYLSRTISLPSLQLTSKPSLWKKGNHKRRDRSKKRNQCSEASNNLWVENRQRVGHEVPCVVVRPLLLKWGLGWEMLGDISYHKATLQSEGKHSIHSENVRPQPLVSGSTLPSQVRTGSTATKVPIVMVLVTPLRYILKISSNQECIHLFLDPVRSEQAAQQVMFLLPACPQQAGPWSTHSDTWGRCAPELHFFQKFWCPELAKFLSWKLGGPKQLYLQVRREQGTHIHQTFRSLLTSLIVFNNRRWKLQTTPGFQKATCMQC